jgi:hypothetical protein
MSWVRSGYCCQCGECCRGRDPFDGELGPPPVPGFCALYRLVDGKGHCSGHEPPNQHPYYLRGCNIWPTQPSHIEAYPLCTYKFEWVDGS